MTEIYISKQALRRYLERAKGITSPIKDDGEALYALQASDLNLDKIRLEVARATKSAIDSGADSVKVGNLRFIIRGRSVLTAVPIRKFWGGGHNHRPSLSGNKIM